MDHKIDKKRLEIEKEGNDYKKRLSTKYSKYEGNDLFKTY